MLIIIFFAIAYTDKTTEIVSMLFYVLTNKFGWLIMLTYAANVAFGLWLSFSKYGSIKIGGENAKKQYSEFEWAAMMTTAALGVGVVVLSFMEPLIFSADPPFGAEPFSDKAYEYAHMTTQFIWSSAWVIFIPSVTAVAYLIYNRKKDILTISSACAPVLGEKRMKGIWGKVIDVLMVFAILGGISTALRYGVPTEAKVLVYLTGWEEGLLLNAGILVVWVAFFGTSVFLGLNKGIKNLSTFNIYLFIAFFVVVAFKTPL